MKPAAEKAAKNIRIPATKAEKAAKNIRIPATKNPTKLNTRIPTKKADRMKTFRPTTIQTKNTFREKTAKS